MMEESNDIFLADGDSVYFAEPVHKKYSKTFNWAIHLVSTCFIANFSSPTLPQHTLVHVLDDPLSIPPVAYILHGWPIS